MATSAREAIDRIDAILEWFKDAVLPTKPFRLNAWTIVENCTHYVNTLRSRVESKDVYSKVVQSSYYHLQQLKNYLENEKH